MGITVDCFGMTDRGKVRERNEDHFLIADLAKSMKVVQTSLSEEEHRRRFGVQHGKLFVVADGMGGVAGGELASGLAIETVTNYVLNTMPWFLLFQQLGLSNTYHALIVSHLVIGLPLVMWIMMGFFEGVHPDLEDAALIDGCSRFGSFLRVALPLTRPGIVVSGILAFIFSWNNLIFAVVLAGPRLQTLPVAVFNVMSFE